MKPLEVPIQLRPKISGYVSRFVIRRRRVAAARAVAIAALSAMLWLLAWAVVDRFATLPSWFRVILLSGLIVQTIAILRGPVLALRRRRIDWRAAALQLERRDLRLGEALATVVSRSLASGSGYSDRSEHLLRQLAGEVEARIDSNGDLSAVVPLRPAGTAWLAAGAGAIIIALLCLWPWLGLPRLFGRQLAPMSSVPAVTTTQLQVEPGSTDLLQGQSLSIIVRPQALPPAAPVLLRTTSDGQNWTAIGMSPAPDGRSFVRSLASISRDTIYEVVAGDAVAGPFTIRALRQPVVTGFRTRLEYPRYVGREPLLITAAGGSIEAPVGTNVTMTVTASEPLKAAALWIGGQRIESSPTDDPSARQFKFRVTSNATCSLEMMSARDVPGAGPGDLSIRAIADRAPLVRISLPPGASVLRARDVLRIPYQVADDYGLTNLEARIEIEHRPATRVPLGVGPDPVRHEDAFVLDLAEQNVAVGDIIVVTLLAMDRAGQQGRSEPCEILVAPQQVIPVTPEQRWRASEMRQAARLAAGITADLTAASQSVDQRNRAGKLASASESATMLVRALLRIGTGLRAPDIAAVLAALVDAAQVQASGLERINLQASSESSGALAEDLARARQMAGQLEPLVTTLWQGVWSDQVLTQRTALRSSLDPEHPAVLRLSDQTETAARELGFDPTEPDLDALLQQRVTEAADQLFRLAPVNLPETARQWAVSAEQGGAFLPQRLNVAAQAESVRGDADPVRVDDLQLASRAARRIEASSRATGATTRPESDFRSAFTAALAALVRDHDLARGGTGIGQAQAERIHSDAATARQAMRAWASESPSQAMAEARPAQNDAPEGDVAPTQGAAPLAESDSELRDPALAAIRQSMEELAGLPQQLGRVEQAAQWARQSWDLEAQAILDAQSAGAENKAAARRAAELASSHADEAFDDLWEISQMVAPDQVLDFVRPLRAQASLTASALGPIDRLLEPALVRLHERIAARDAVGIQRALADSRRAIVAVQDGLHDARAALLQRDPMIAARWFALQAAARNPTTNSDAAPQQNLPDDRDILAALRRAWDDSFHPGGEGAQAIVGVPQLPLWNRPAAFSLRGDDLSVLSREADPPGYHDALRAYFQIVGRSQDQGAP